MDTQNSPRQALLITGISFILGWLFDYFFYEKSLGIGFPLYISFIIAGLFAVSIYSKKPLSKNTLWLLVPLIFFSSMVFIRASALLTFLNTVASLLLLLLIAETASSGSLTRFLISDHVKNIFLPFKFIRPFLQTFPRVFQLRSNQSGPTVSSQVIKGVIISLPFVFIFLVLFSSADLVFQKYISHILSIGLDPQLTLRTILVACITAIFIGAYAYTLGNRVIPPSVRTTTTLPPVIGRIETLVLLTLVNIVFFAFILIQLTYLFGGENAIASQGFTYAEYARAGFFELLMTTMLTLLLLLATEKYTAKKEASGHTLAFQFSSVILIAQIMLIIASAFKRLSLYESAYGFTTLRLYSHAFTLLLAVIFLLLLCKILRDQEENIFAFRSSIAIIMFLAALNLLNPDALIARENIGRLATTGTIDTNYLNSLSDDALPEVMQILTLPNEDLKRSIAQNLSWRVADDSSEASPWQTYNLSRQNAHDLLQSKKAQIKWYDTDYQPVP